MAFFDSMNISATGLSAQRLRMDVISENIANVNTTRGADGKPYKRKIALFEEINEARPFSSFMDAAMSKTSNGQGVRVGSIVNDESVGNRVYDPGHPDADAEGYVTMPNVNIVMEMVNMISTSRSYEANVTAMNSTKAMITKTMELSR